MLYIFMFSQEKIEYKGCAKHRKSQKCSEAHSEVAYSKNIVNMFVWKTPEEFNYESDSSVSE